MPTARRPQRTIGREVGVRGVSFLSGLDVGLRFIPADPDAGLTFVRTDLPGRPSVPAHVRHVVPRQRRTTLQRGDAVVEMVEHVLAALAGLRVDNCAVEIDGPEAPGCDGSSLAFVEAIAEAGAVDQDRPRAVLAIDRPITVREGPATLTAHPGEADDRLVLSYHLDYGRRNPIGRQSLFVDLSPESFRDELAGSRTFVLEAEAEALKEAGIGPRTTEADILIFGPDGPIGNCLRFPDECVRHKILDMVGDLALIGRDLAGHVVAHRSGHQLNAALARKLLEAAGADLDGPAGADGDGEGSGLDIEAIMRVLPHRYPFLLVDRVIERDPGRSVVALKNVSCNEPFFAGHWPGRPIMPGVLILEALAQAAGLMFDDRVEPKRVALIASIDGAKIRRPVVPGDQLRLEVQATRSRTRSFDVRGVARVGGKVVAEARIRFVLVGDERAA